MKTLFLLFAVLTINNYLFSQIMVIHTNDGLKDTVALAKVDSIKLLPFQCGVDQVSYASKIYNTVQIGTQCWLKENLDVGTRIDGSSQQTNNSILEKYCYNNDPANCTAYGGLYQWAETVQYMNGATNTTSPNPAFTGNVQGICPIGWHIPTMSEFQTLATTVSNEGNALKAIGQGSGVGAGTNTSGFSALLVGYCDGNNGGFYAIDSHMYMWSTQELDATRTYFMRLYAPENVIQYRYGGKVGGFSVRCVKN